MKSDQSDQFKRQYYGCNCILSDTEPKILLLQDVIKQEWNFKLLTITAYISACMNINCVKQKVHLISTMKII